MDVGVSHKGWHLWGVKHLKKRKAGEEDGIVAELLVYGIDVREDGEKSLVNVIQRLFAKVFQSGEVPKYWKDAIIIPVPKKGDANLCDNYRGITLLSVVGNLLTYILAKRA